VLLDRPKLKDLNNHVREAVIADWYDLGVQLDLEDKLDEIQANKPSNTKECCTEMFKFWRRSDPKASWKKLIEALEAPSLCLHELAQTLRHKLKSGEVVVFVQCYIKLVGVLVLCSFRQYIYIRGHEALGFSRQCYHYDFPSRQLSSTLVRGG